MDRETHEIRLANWKALIEQCQARPKGQTTKQWLSDHDISEKQYYYWLRKVRKRAVAEMKPLIPAVAEQQHQDITLAEIPVEKFISPDTVPAITIRTKKSTIEISSAVPETVMIKLIKAVTHAL